MLSTKWAHKFWLSTVVIWADRKYEMGKNGWKFKEFRYRELQIFLKIHIEQVVFLYPPTSPMNLAPLVIPKFNLLGDSCSLLRERSRNDQERPIRSTNVIILEQVEVEAPADKITQLISWIFLVPIYLSSKKNLILALKSGATNLRWRFSEGG